MPHRGNLTALRSTPGKDLFAESRRPKLALAIARCRTNAARRLPEEWALLTELEQHILALEQRIRQRIDSLGWVRLLKTCRA